MIIKLLADFYPRIASPPGFVKAVVSYVVELDGDANLLAIRTLSQQDAKKPGVPMDIPVGPVRSNNPPAYFLVDNAAFTLGAAIDPLHASRAKRDAAIKKLAQAETYFARFRAKQHELLAAVVASGHDPSLLRALCAFLGTHDPEQFRASGMMGMAKNENFFEGRITFAVNGQWLIENDDIMATLAQVALADLASTDTAVCGVTGRVGPVAKNHAKLKGVPHSLSNQSSLVSFNETAFQAYGEDTPAPISVEAMVAYTGAANFMLGMGGGDHRRTIGDTAFLLWGSEDAALEQIREVLLVEEPGEPSSKVKGTEQVAQRVFDSPFTGHDIRSPASVNVLGLTAAQARAGVSYWSAGSLADLSRNIGLWVDEIEAGAGYHWGHPLYGKPWRPTVGRMTRLLGGEGKGESVSRARGRIARALAACAFESALVPTQLAYTAARTALYGDWPGGSSNGDYACLMGLLAAYEVRHRNQTVEALMTDNMYLLGRFYALVEKTEIDSLRARGARVAAAPVTRVKKAIYTRPRWGFQQLDERFEIALRRLPAEHQGYLRKRRTDTLAGLEAEPFPLAARDGNLFLIGAQHESHTLWMPKTAQQAA